MKKLLSGFIVLCLLTAFSVFTADAEVNGKIKADNVSGTAGKTVEVPVYIEDNPGIIALRLSIEYDTNKAELTDCKNGEVFNSSTVSFSDKFTSPFVFLYEDGLAKEENFNNGKAFILTFKLNADIDDEPLIKIKPDAESIFDISLNNVSFAVSDGSKSETAEKSAASSVKKSISESASSQTEKADTADVKSEIKNRDSAEQNESKIDNEKSESEKENKKSYKAIIIFSVLLIFILSALMLIKLKHKKDT